jgi:hypothetical protein
MHETSEDKMCLADLRLTYPRNDKKRIEETKGGLLKDAYRWILDNGTKGPRIDCVHVYVHASHIVLRPF